MNGFSQNPWACGDVKQMEKAHKCSVIRQNGQYKQRLKFAMLSKSNQSEHGIQQLRLVKTDFCFGCCRLVYITFFWSSETDNRNKKKKKEEGLNKLGCSLAYQYCK